MTGMAGSLLEDLKQQIQTQHHVGQTQLQILQQQAQQYQAPQPPLQPQKQPPQPPQQQAVSKLLKQEQTNIASAECPIMKDVPSYKEAEEIAEKQEKPKQECTSEGEGLKEGKDTKKQKSLEPCIPPPRIASGARGNAAKALLENFGFELVIQYNENRQKVQKKGKSGEGENTDKLECGTCARAAPCTSSPARPAAAPDGHSVCGPHSALPATARIRSQLLKAFSVQTPTDKNHRRPTENPEGLF